MLNLNIRREIRKDAIRIIQEAGMPGQTSPQDIVVKLLQILQKNNPRTLSDSTKLIETYLNYLERLVGTEWKESQASNERRILSVLETSFPSTGRKPLCKYALQYNYNGKEIAVNQDLAKLAVRVLSTYMRTSNLLSAVEISQAYQRIYVAILNSVVPRFN